MAKTQIADLSVMPETFAGYVAEQSVTRNPLIAAGVIRMVPGLSFNKGDKINVPNFKPLARGASVLADNASLTPKKMGTGNQMAVVNNRGVAYSGNDLVAAYAGEDFWGYAAGELANVWNDEIGNQAVSILKGAAASDVIPVHDISAEAGAAASFSASAFIDARYKLGAQRGKLGVLYCHSAVSALIEKQNIDTTRVATSDGGSVLTYRGMTVVEDDTLEAVTDVYTAFLLGQGAFGFADALNLVEAETQRDALAGDTHLVSRRSYVLHPAGLSCALNIGANGQSPTNAELEADGAWTQVYDTKNIPIVAFKFKL